MSKIALTIAAHVREAESYRRKASAARTLHAVREAAGSACNVAANIARVAPVEMTCAAMREQGLNEAVACDMVRLHRIAADAATIARLRFREQGDEMTAHQWEKQRDGHKLTANEWETVAARLAEEN